MIQDKLEVLKEICCWYNYDLTLKENGEIRCYNCIDYDFKYENIDIALKHWIDTLKDTDEDMIKCGESPMWEEEIKFIENIA